MWRGGCLKSTIVPALQLTDSKSVFPVVILQKHKSCPVVLGVRLYFPVAAAAAATASTLLGIAHKIVPALGFGPFTM